MWAWAKCSYAGKYITGVGIGQESNKTACGLSQARPHTTHHTPPHQGGHRSETSDGLAIGVVPVPAMIRHGGEMMDGGPTLRETWTRHGGTYHAISS